MPRLLLLFLVASLILITLAVMLAVKSLTPDGEEGHRVFPRRGVMELPKP